MSERVLYGCVSCGKRFAPALRPFCDACGGMVDVTYDLAAVRLVESDDAVTRFGDLLPIVDPARRLPVALPVTATVHARRLGERLGLPWLFLKNETTLPTGTTKDRMAVVSLAYLAECGVTGFTTSSTGNSSTSYARFVPLAPGLTMTLFTGERWAGRVAHADHPQVRHFVLRGGTFVEAFDAAGAYASAHGLVSERGFFNPGRREGLKLAYLEAFEQVERATGRAVDTYVQAVSSAMGVWGCHKASQELHGLGRAPHAARLVCVQQDTCAPMVRAFEAGSPTIRPDDIVREPRGIAAAILRGDPSRVYPYIRKIVVESGGAFVAVSEDDMRQARALVRDDEGIDCCFSSAAAVAGLAKLAAQGRMSRDETIVVNLTGRDRPDVEVRHATWLVRGASGWVPE